MAFFRSAILALALTSAVFAQNVASPLSMYNPAAMNPATAAMNPMMNPQMMGMMGGYPYMGQQQQLSMLNPYQSMMPGSMMGMNPMMMAGGYPQMGQQSMFGMNPYQQQSLMGMPGSMMGMPGMQGYGNPPMMNNPMMMSPYNGMSGLTQSPYGLPMGQQQQAMFGMNPYQSMMGLQSPLMGRM